MLICWLIPIFDAILISGFHLTDKGYIAEQKKKRKVGNALINLLVLITFFRAGSSGDVLGAHEAHSSDFGGFDSGSGGEGGGGGE